MRRIDEPDWVIQTKVIAALLIDELERANRMYGTSFASPHEGYAVMLEELDELFEEIRQKRPNKERLREEAIQVGAMAIKFIMSLEKGTSPSSPMSQEKLLENVAKCRQCLFAVLTSGELAELGSDPCETCNGDLCNWQTNQRGNEIAGFPPCFYDAATIAAHQAALGFALPVFETSSGVLYSTYKPSLDWLANMNWSFTQALRDYFRSICTGKFGVLFYAPSVIGAAIPSIISVVNYLKTQWARPALDFFEVEDYDWVIDGSPQHAQAYTLALKDLKYSLKETHYFAGYVENAAPLSSSIWQDVNRAILSGFSAGFETVVLWAMTQVRRDGWTAPPLVWGMEAVEESELLFK